MKNNVLFLLTAIVCLSLSMDGYAQLNVSTPISVTDGDTSFGRRSPKLALNANGELMVFWMRTGNEAFYLSTKTGGVFSDPVQIPFGVLNPNLWSGSLGPNMASHGDDVYVTFEVYGDAIYVTHSPDAGQTWEAPVAAFTPPAGRRATIPTIAVDSSGNPYVAYVNTDTSEDDAYYGMVRSIDFGQTFMAEVNVSEYADGVEVCECCNGHIDVAPNGDVYVAFRNNNANLRDIWLVKSIDGGSTFSLAYDVDETDWTANVCPSNGPHFSIHDDNIVTTFFSGTGSSGSGNYFSSFDTTTSTPGPTVDLPYSDPGSNNQNRPRVAGAGDTLAIVWQENTSNSIDIAMSVSTTGADGLILNPFLLSSLPSSQQYPATVFDGQSFHVVYEDNESNTLLYQEVSFGAVGLNENFSFEFSVQPNPTQGQIEVRHVEQEALELRLIDVTGREVYRGSIDQSPTVIDLGLLKPGIHQLVLSNKKRYSSQKLLVE